MNIQVKRIYEPVGQDDGFRVLVDRLWPRGISKERAQIDQWAKDIAPSAELRKQFNHVPERFDAFAESYLDELAGMQPALDELRARAAGGTVTLLYAARNEQQNHARILAEALREG
jgi:uncharacterized protein YeaO (DUF488 family)